MATKAKITKAKTETTPDAAEFAHAASVVADIAAPAVKPVPVKKPAPAKPAAKRDNAPPKGAAAAAKAAKAKAAALPPHKATRGETAEQRKVRWAFRTTPQGFHRGTEIFIDPTKLGDVVLPKAFAVDTKYTIISVFQPVETESGVCEVTLRDGAGDLHGYVPAGVLSHWKTFGKVKPEQTPEIAETESIPLTAQTGIEPSDGAVDAPESEAQ